MHLRTWRSIFIPIILLRLVLSPFVYSIHWNPKKRDKNESYKGLKTSIFISMRMSIQKIYAFTYADAHANKCILFHVSRTAVKLAAGCHFNKLLILPGRRVAKSAIQSSTHTRSYFEIKYDNEKCLSSCKHIWEIYHSYILVYMWICNTCILWDLDIEHPIVRTYMRYYFSACFIIIYIFFNFFFVFFCLLIILIFLCCSFGYHILSEPN